MISQGRSFDGTRGWETARAPVCAGKLSLTKGALPSWLQQREVRATLVLPERSNLRLVQHVLEVGYAPDLDDVEIEEIGKDPFLVAAALSAPDRFVVTREVTKKTQARAKRRLPDVCEALSASCITDFQAYKQLAFSLPG